MAGLLSCFVQNFCSLWQAGNDARLTLNTTRDKHRFIYNSIFTINHTLNHILSHNNNTAVTLDPLISAAAQDRVKLEIQMSKLPPPLLIWQNRMTILSPTHSIKMCLHIKLQLHKLG